MKPLGQACQRFHLRPGSQNASPTRTIPEKPGRPVPAMLSEQDPPSLRTLESRSQGSHHGLPTASDPPRVPGDGSGDVTGGKIRPPSACSKAAPKAPTTDFPSPSHRKQSAPSPCGRFRRFYRSKVRPPSACSKDTPKAPTGSHFSPRGALAPVGIPARGSLGRLVAGFLSLFLYFSHA